MLAQKNIFHFSTLILTRGGTLRWMMASTPRVQQKMDRPIFDMLAPQPRASQRPYPESLKIDFEAASPT
jgi:hypothetical protein